MADRLRPTVWQDFVGQKEVIGSGTPLRQLIEQDQVPSLIFWGPPGSGKTTLARLIAKLTRSDFIQLPAVASGLADLRQVVARASDRRKLHQTRTILFIDEIHRWNKAQQDALLPHVENGTVTLIGATTENPSFEVISALLSRCRVIIIKALAPEDIESILQRALKDKEYGFGKIKVEGATQAIKHLAIMASGDARVALNTLELAVKASLKDNQSVITDELIKQSLQRTHLVYDKGGEEHFNLISALHKSMRGSNPDAALYWLGRMLEAGEDPLYIARRLIRFASEDIGLADPQALVQATAGFQAAHNIGMPECNVILAQTVVYLANAPKSNSLYKAYQAVQQDVKATINEGVPLHLRNAPTDLMKEVGYGQGYKYNPDYDEPVEQDYLPPSLKGRKYLDNKNYQSKI
ncbi:MAG: AAA family ATPase [Candidatus Veblenbacteria bacterium RIFOXYC1_FULL_42_9]|uniref:Replication-associated recombination protein A n=4 Tax=Candidatus Vebleniibacteriota TaxID=1817921 RepID=A0A1G2Q4U8_9BACT|nr:MAG: AAA family ATPase [Candidatus Veblenbacteria bacterium RIFOXYA2_FULL_43_9]OHA55049.1 MAG: AAA family ATPase [Candidatus Veblenbacteria bacterium RIFOXYC1_FULL_42_9]OHA56365.1 MAG: AAA family ATPase [Candidatus Veblenbacteria bacterium RIFOXYD1_FULL_43_11]OHA56654.1 MAG: AAA family ATPase [Candidatus Veblenbacteria bacterium RIFOXYC2_FULL_42_11]